MLILAGVAIHFTIGENGILRNAGIARNKYKEAGENEANLLDKAYAYINGEEISYPPNTPETPAGARVAMPENWYTQTASMYSLTEQKTIKKSTRTANVYAVSDGENNTIPIPNGFYYVGGNLNSGVVISDSVKDEGKYKNEPNGMVPSGVKVVEENGIKRLESDLQGNQFVWIPCTKEKYHKTSWGQGNVNGTVTSTKLCYGYWDLTTNSAEMPQILKYGGFYVGRYEAGLPEDAEEFLEGLHYSNDIYNFEGMPQCKAGKRVWNFINWENSQKNAIKMYEKSESVKSGLITSTQWDVILKKIEEIEEKDLTDSREWGNHINGTEFQYTGRASLYLFSTNLQYAYGEIEENGTKKDGEAYLLTTGASNSNRVYNIYDIAGNLSEYVEETCVTNKITAIQTNRCQRGGSFNFNDPVCVRDIGEYSHEATMGFRCVLYLN